ncbi:MAG: hypothetical protein B6D46_03935 [Polyangiaceae bacterium UTPRO1]|jgi:DMSO reductase family type II enzyme molybdopterin subunit|nr:molybdopterin-dependent oxidoreductase [Myxococcales bacterium]OQY68346.1 MAG: hypothetical protein B6D46_03935 [Polyangiaceae bacterium UTPRO1]
MRFDPVLRRRDFLRLAALAAASASSGCSLLVRAAGRGAPAGAGAMRRPPRLGTWEDLYRQRWSWDAVAKGSHGWLNCRSACNWDLYIKDGLVVREEQTANYEASEAGIPDFNPRGCQKGACYTEVMYGPSRLTVPLKRVGERGSGRWERVSWEQALDEIAAKLVSIAERHGTDAIVHDLGPHFDQGPTTAVRPRFFGFLGASMMDDWAEIGDLNVGATMTFGFPHIGGSADEWFLSDHLVVWMMNPAVTQIPDAHFLFEAKYAGAELVVVDPTYSATATHADLWLPLRPGTDAALALATARYIWDGGFADLDYVREQTDLTMLVRLDTGRFLRESDVAAEGHPERLYLWDTATGRAVIAPGCAGNAADGKIALGRLRPAIAGRFSMTLADGATVGVAPVGALLREHLEPWTLDEAARVTGLSRAQVERFADDFARARRPMVLSSWGSNRYLHSDQMNRAKILCLALKGAIGRRGGGYHNTGWVGIEGFDGVTAAAEHTGLRGRFAIFDLVDKGLLFDLILDQTMRRKSRAQVQWELGRNYEERNACMANSASMNLAYQGVRDDLDRELAGLYPRRLSEYDEESRAHGWMPRLPRHQQPRAWFTGGNNFLRRTNLPQRAIATMWPALELIVDVNPKLTFTGMHADYLLPAAGYYEKPGFKYPVAYVPYLHYCDEAVRPIADSKNEWEIFSLLAERVQAVARARNTPILDGCGKRPIDLKRIAEKLSFHGAFGPQDAMKVAQRILDTSTSTAGMSVAALKETGIAKYTGTGAVGGQPQLFNEDWKGQGVLRPATLFTEKKWRWPTLTGRQQFYIDHAWFLEAGEALPTHIESPKAGGDHPFQLVSCHARWSIHSVWRDDPMLLRLQRGEPQIYLNPGDAARLRVADGGWAELANDYGSVLMRAKHSTMVRPGIAYYFHAWEPHQFPAHKSYKEITPGLMNPMHFAGGEGQFVWRFGVWAPGTHVQDTRVSIRRGDLRAWLARMEKERVRLEKERARSTEEAAR